jgi:hypothetical protein
VTLLLRHRVAARRRTTGGGAVSDWSTPLLVYTGCSAVQASGGSFSRYQDLSGADFDNTVNSAPIGNVVTLAAGTFAFSDFATTLSIPCGAGITRTGLRGMSTASTIIQMTASTSTKASQVPTQSAGGTNQLYLMAFDHDNLDLSCFTLQGTAQGHFYNGIRMLAIANGNLRNLKFIGAAPGNWHIPPGETFVINDYQGSNNTYSNIECDGRLDGATGIGDGASAFGQNSATNGTFNDCYAHHFPYSAAFALWQGGGTVTINRGRSDQNRTALNLERMGQEAIGGATCTINLYDFEFGTYIQTALGYGQDIFLGNDRGSTKINFYRPKITAGRTVPSGRPAGQCFVYWPAQEQGNTNLQLKADVKAYDANGTDISSTFFAWSR